MKLDFLSLSILLFCYCGITSSTSLSTEENLSKILNGLLEKRSSRPLYRGSINFPQGDVKNKEMDELLTFMEDSVRKYRASGESVEMKKENLIREMLPWVINHLANQVDKKEVIHLFILLLFFAS